MNAPVCSRCQGLGIEFGVPGVSQFCPDCLLGNTLALKAQGSSLDPAKYPACQFEGAEACDDSGKLPSGGSCDCDKTSILGFEGYGCSHEVAIKVMCALCSCDQGCSDPVLTLVDRIDEAHNCSTDNAAVAAALTRVIQESPEAVQQALDHNWLRRFL